MTTAKVVQVTNVEKHPNADRLTLNTLSNGVMCISNKTEDGNHRYKQGDLVVFVDVGAKIPNWLIKRQHLWDETKNKGILDGPDGNIVKPITLRKIESKGMLVALEQLDVQHGILLLEGSKTDVMVNQDVTHLLCI